MNYSAGVLHMQNLARNLLASNQPTGSFTRGNLLINYPGYKKLGDYKLTENGVAPKHTDIVDIIHANTNANNFNDVVLFLEDVYTNGLQGNLIFINPVFREKIFWITLQEEINYPQPKFAGRKLPFQRFFEAALIHRGLITRHQVHERTNNHRGPRPQLLPLNGINIPVFYVA